MYSSKKISKCRENGKDRLRKGNVRRCYVPHGLSLISYPMCAHGISVNYLRAP